MAHGRHDGRAEPTTPRVAYLINQYPKVSHSFIRTEIEELERQGAAVLRLALRGWNAELVDSADIAERERTRYVLAGGAAALLWALIRIASTQPRRFAAALATAVRLGRSADRPLLLHLIYLAEACVALPWIEAFGATHVHTHFGSNAPEVALLARMLGGPPYSFTVHGPEEFDKPLQLKLREKVQGAAFVVAITSFCRSQLFRWTDPADWDRIRIVHCGLDDAFLAAPASPPPAAPRLVCVGRICEQKGQLLLVKACAVLKERGVAVELVLAGDGEMRGAVEAAIARHGLSDQVSITGWLSGEEVRAVLGEARGLVLPSFGEGLPVVIMEAMALGRPPITTYIAGIPELVRDGVEGLLVPAGDVEALADAMERFLAMEPAALDAMAERARARVRERHAIGPQAAKLLALFSEGRG